MIGFAACWFPSRSTQRAFPLAALLINLGLVDYSPCSTASWRGRRSSRRTRFVPAGGRTFVLSSPILALLFWQCPIWRRLGGSATRGDAALSGLFFLGWLIVL